MILLCRKSKRQRLNPEEPVELSPAVADVIENYDLLREILLRVGSTDGLVLAERQKLSQVSKFWREICRSLPVRVAFSKPMTPEQVAISLLFRIRNFCAKAITSIATICQYLIPTATQAFYHIWLLLVKMGLILTKHAIKPF